MRKVRSIFLTESQCIDIVTSMNFEKSKKLIISRKLYIKLVEYGLIDDIDCNVCVSTLFHSPFPYSVEL